MIDAVWSISAQYDAVVAYNRRLAADCRARTGPVRSVVTDLAQHLGHALDRVLLREQRDRLRTAAAGLPG